MYPFTKIIIYCACTFFFDRTVKVFSTDHTQHGLKKSCNKLSGYFSFVLTVLVIFITKTCLHIACNSIDSRQISGRYLALSVRYLWTKLGKHDTNKANL